MILQGDALSVLKTLPDEHVDTSICSPPYWRLRRYLPDEDPNKPLEIGTEPSYNEYVTRLCDVFDEVKRVLKPQGTCWIVMADQFSNDGGGRPSLYESKAQRYGFTLPKRPKSDIPKKSLCLIPFRLAIEMVRRGWILRNTLIWRKPNSLPSTAKDRFTIDFEYLFFFARSPRYYFNQQFEPAVYAKGMRNHRSILDVNTKPLFSNHFAVYPEELVEMPIKAASPIGGTVLDLFGGMSTTALVAERLGRKGISIELNPEYVRLGTERLAGLTKQS